MSYTTNPGYLDLVRDMFTAAKLYYSHEQWHNYTFPAGFIQDFKKYYHFNTNDYFLILYIAIASTLIRYLFELYLCKPIINYMKLDDKSSRAKFPESAWKFLIYGILWGYCCYLLIFSGKYDFFSKPWLIWEDWQLGMQVPFDIRLLYLVECGFYLHSIYATICMDTWRKDSIVMLIHHVLTMTLILVSYATRYHKVGLNVLFVHDITDILLEFTKINTYIKNRNKKYFPINEYVANIGFGVFTVAWYIFRLYWFPLKILYSTGVVAVHRAFFRGAGLYGFFNSLLFILLLLDIYWFYYIVLFLYKVVKGELKEINDTREYEENTNQENESKKTE